jgi:hypothetical protein
MWVIRVERVEYTEVVFIILWGSLLNITHIWGSKLHHIVLFPP